MNATLYSIGLLCFLESLVAGTAQVQLVSRADPRLPATVTGRGMSSSPRITPDGRYVVFLSDALNLTGIRQNSIINVYLRDRELMSTTLISVDTNGLVGGNGDSQVPSVSSNGQWVTFLSTANNLVSKSSNSTNKVFLRDVSSGKSFLVSENGDGNAANGPASYAVLSKDGRVVAFESLASNLTPNDTNSATDVFAYDVASQRIILVSGNAIGSGPGNGASTLTDISADGRFVLFTSMSTDLVANTTNTAGEVFVRDLVANRTIWISSNATHMDIVRPLQSQSPAFSADGRKVAFQIFNSSVLLHAYYDLVTGATRLVGSNLLYSVDVNGIAWNYIPSYSPPRISADGRFVAYVGPTFAQVNPDVSATVGINNVYVWDADTGRSVLASVSRDGQEAGNASSDSPLLSADGSTLAFISAATNLTVDSVNGLAQIYTRNLATGTTRLISTNRNGSVSAVGDVGAMDLSADGSSLVFDTVDGQMSEIDNNSDQDVFLSDSRLGQRELISVGNTNLISTTASSASFNAKNGVSSNGRYVTFSSDANNLVDGSVGAGRNGYWRDLTAGTTRLIGGNPLGTNSFQANILTPFLSGDGRFIVFVSNTEDLAPSNTNSTYEVFMQDMSNGAIQLISVNAVNSLPANGSSSAPWIGVSSNVVIFRSMATDLLTTNYSTTKALWYARDLTSHTLSVFNPTTLNMLSNPTEFVGLSGSQAILDGAGIFTYDMQSGTWTNLESLIREASLSQNNRWLVYAEPHSAAGSVLFVYELINHTNFSIEAPGTGYLQNISDSGTRVVFDAAYSSNLKIKRQIYVYDTGLDSNILISVSQADTDGSQGGNGDSWSPQISPDGRFVVFQSLASDLVSNDNNGLIDIFVRDLEAGKTYCLSMNYEGTATGSGSSVNPVLSGDGTTVVFSSDAPDIVENDLNNVADVFVAPMPVVSELRILNATIVPGGGAIVRWTATAGKTYRLQYKNNLTDVNWTDVAGDITSVSEKAEKSDDSAANASQRYYRVLMNP